MLAGSPEKFKEKMLADFRRKYGNPMDSMSNVVGADDVAITAAIFAGIASCIAATAIPIMAVGVSILLILFGVAIIYAIHEGYDVENVELGTGSGADLRPTLKFSLKKK